MKFLARIILANVLVGTTGHLVAYFRYINNPFLIESKAGGQSVPTVIFILFLVALVLGITGFIAYRMLTAMDQFLYWFEKDRRRLQRFPPEQVARVGVESYNLPFTGVLLSFFLGVGMALIVHVFNYTIPYRGMLDLFSQFRLILDYVMVIFMTGIFVFFVNSIFLPGLIHRIVEAGFPLPDYRQPGLVRLELGVKLGAAFLCVVFFTLYLSSADIFSVFQAFQSGGKVSTAALAPVKARLFTNVIIYGAYSGLLVLVATRSVIAPLARLVRGTSRIASGHLHPDEVFIPISVDELGDLSGSVDGMRENLARQLEEIRTQSKQVERFIDTIRDILPSLVGLVDRMMWFSKKQEMEADQQFESVRMVGSRIEDLSQVVMGISGSIQAVVAQTGTAQRAGEEGIRAIGDSRRSIAEIAEGAKEMEERIRVFSNLGEDVEKILQIIEGIANRSDMLALNATLLGAKAGESGAGFMLIAERLRGLAEEVMREANRVRPILKQIEVNARGVLREIEHNREETRTSQQMVVQADESFREIYRVVGQTREAADEISRDADQQKSLAAGMVRDISAASGIAEEARQASRDSTKMAERLTQISGRLEILMGEKSGG